MIGATRMVWATIIACGVNSRPQRAERPGARKQQVDDQPDYHRRQAHQRIESDDHSFAARKPDERDGSAEREADQGRKAHCCQADRRDSPTIAINAGIGARHKKKHIFQHIELPPLNLDRLCRLFP